ncbi:MAG: undecaprenyl-diphosphate phosphatase [Actinomycetota bacterium]|nr:undecaprenyl-diphosphate phosphatase [Actinomycetota bacterium]
MKAPESDDTQMKVVMLVIIGVAATVICAMWAVASTDALTLPDALLLGVVEGITEYLPVSSTGHLTVVQRLLGIGNTEADKAAADAYAICIQAGAILAVLGLYRERVGSVILGVVGRDPQGFRLAQVLIAAFTPAAAIAFVFEDAIKDNLFGIAPVVAAWAVGGVAILVIAPRVWGGARRIEELTIRDGLIIGFAQVLALWPGTSRSLVTILAAGALGVKARDAVELSFILGLMTLGAATIYEGIGEGTNIVDTFGIVSPVVGLLAAWVSAIVAVRWMVDYLNRNGMAVFGWYRLGIAAVVGALLLAGVVSSDVEPAEDESPVITVPTSSTVE